MNPLLFPCKEQEYLPLPCEDCGSDILPNRQLYVSPKEFYEQFFICCEAHTHEECYRRILGCRTYPICRYALNEDRSIDYINADLFDDLIRTRANKWCRHIINNYHHAHLQISIVICLNSSVVCYGTSCHLV